MSRRKFHNPFKIRPIDVETEESMFNDSGSDIKESSNSIENPIYYRSRRDINNLITLLKNDPTNPKIKEKFCTALKKKDLQMIKALHKNGFKIDQALNDSGQTAIDLLLTWNSKDDLDLMNQLFRYCNRNANPVDVTGLSPFHIARANGLRKHNLGFIKADINVNFPVGFNGPTSLHLAVKNLRPDVVKLLLHNSANPNAVDEAGRTPLHLACGIHESIGEAILPRVSFTLKPKAKKGSKKKWNITSAEKISEQTMEIVRELIRSGSNIDAKDRCGESPLFHIFRDDTRDYVARKFSRNTLDYKDHFRRRKSSMFNMLKDKQYEKFKFLLSRKPDVIGIVNVDTGDTILHKIVKNLELWFDPKYPGDSNFNQIFQVPMIQDVLKLGVDINAENKYGETALSIATSILSLNIVTLLRNRGADPRDIYFGNGFRHPQLLPSLEVVHNLIEIVKMRKSGLNEQETLTVLRFLIDNNNQCKYADPKDEDASFKLQNLLEFGTDENIITTMQRIREDCGYSRRIVNCQVGGYLVKIAKNDMCLNSDVANCLNRIITERPGVSRDFEEYQAEAKKLNEIRFASGRSLASILTAPPAEVFSFLRRGELREILYVRYLELKKTFRHNWGIITGFFAKFLIRRFVVTLLNEQIRLVSGKQLPDNCCESIAIYLSNMDLLRLCIASIAEVPRREVEAEALVDGISSSLIIV